jgi:two-component system NtrC family sensor kinase
MAKRGRTVRRQPAKRKASAKRNRAPRRIDLKNQSGSLSRELNEARQQLAATREVLEIINTSPGTIAPVFEALLEKAMHLCEAAFGFLAIYDGERFKFAAQHGVPPALADYFETGMDQARPGDAHWRLLEGEDLIHNLDQMNEDAYRAGNPLRRALVDLGGARSALVVALRKDGILRGAITIYRKEVRPFSTTQVALLQHFAAQAVIAIENVRLFDEVQARTEDLRESLQQQTATADVLKVISRSAFDLETVLQTLVESAARLCEADKATITRQKDAVFYRAESFGFSREFMDYVRDIPVAPDRGSATGRALLEGVAVHIPDVKADADYRFDEALRLGNYRALLAAPMMREGTPIGVVTLTRSEARPFTEKQIELVTTFADQAAIAIENVRLFEQVQQRTKELSKSLDELCAAQDRLIQTEKLASLGQLTAGIAHEIKNPLNFVNNFSALSVELVDELDDLLRAATLDHKTWEETSELTKMLKGNLEKVVQHGKRADSIVKNMLLHSREGAGECRPVDLNSLVAESLSLAYHGARAERQEFQIRLDQNFDPAAGEIELFPQEITRVLLNLISNGFYAAMKRKAEMSNGYEPVLGATTRNLGDYVEIRIRDNGRGIPPEVKEKMFDPFFTTKPPGEGTGLGLSLSYDIIVKQHAGSIEVDTQPGEFTEFSVRLPRKASASKARANS